MAEALGTAVLLKAVDFFFGEGREALESWRERRAARREKGHELEGAGSETPPASGHSTHSDAGVDVKTELLGMEVSQSALTLKRGEVAHLLELLEIHVRNYRRAEKQAAEWGSALLPPIVANTLDAEGNAVEDTMRRLQGVLSDVYGSPVDIPELEGNGP